MQKLTKFKVIFALFTVCVYFIPQQNCKLYYIYLMIISEILGHYSCDSAKFKAPADFSNDAILLFDIVLKIQKGSLNCVLSYYMAIIKTESVQLMPIICRTKR